MTSNHILVLLILVSGLLYTSCVPALAGVGGYATAVDGHKVAAHDELLMDGAERALIRLEDNAAAEEEAIHRQEEESRHRQEEEARHRQEEEVRHRQEILVAEAAPISPEHVLVPPMASIAVDPTEGTLVIFVCVRNRDKEKKEFTAYMSSFLSFTNQPYRLYYINQADEFQFNRGKLFNAGVSYDTNRTQALGWPRADLYSFHDVDLLPMSGVAYSIPEEYQLRRENYFSQLSSEMSNFHWSKPMYLHGRNCGGVDLCTPEAFQATNGYSNNYWGWGGEDDNMVTRLLASNVLVEKQYCVLPPPGHGRFFTDDNGPMKSTSTFIKDIHPDWTKSTHLEEGLSTVDYVVGKTIYLADAGSTILSEGEAAKCNRLIIDVEVSFPLSEVAIRFSANRFPPCERAGDCSEVCDCRKDWQGQCHCVTEG